MLFIKFKKCNDENIHNALTQTIMMYRNLVQSGHYFYYKGKLCIVFDTEYSKVPLSHPSIAPVFQTFANLLPQEKKYKTYDIWSKEKWREEVPEKIKDTTGTVYLFNTNANII